LASAAARLFMSQESAFQGPGAGLNCQKLNVQSSTNTFAMTEMSCERHCLNERVDVESRRKKGSNRNKGICPDRSRKALRGQEPSIVLPMEMAFEPEQRAACSGDHLTTYIALVTHCEVMVLVPAIVPATSGHRM
jgi:hypothetical protein